MYCGTLNIKKKGRRHNRQRYICLICRRQFQSRNKPTRMRRAIWHQYIWHRQKVVDLAQYYHRSVSWIRKQIKEVQVNPNVAEPQPAVIVIDSTFYKRIFGIMVVRVPELKQNIYWKIIPSETIYEYLEARQWLENQGWAIQAVVLDGRPGAKAVFADLPVQMCHYHQKAILNRYLTTRPKLEASIELRRLTSSLTKMNEQKFRNVLDEWYLKWSAFLKERTIDPFDPKRWHYTHRRIRSAHHSLKTNLPFLFTYQEYLDLNIPNTTNCLDGYFSHLKELTKIHRGLNRETKLKMIVEILSKTDPQKYH